MEVASDKLEELAERASQEFSDAADYIWKSPRLITHETELELKKLPAYFPNDPDHAKIRWQFESDKLKRVFPYLIAIGNLFSVVSLFESYLLLFANEIERRTGKPISSVRGHGVNRLFNYFRELGLALEKVENYHQVQAAIKIRNCLAHASGLLKWSREAQELKRIQKSGSYLSKEHRKRRETSGGEYDEVQVVTSGLGERLQVNNEYAFIVTSYLSEFFIGTCQLAASLKQNGNSKGT